MADENGWDDGSEHPEEEEQEQEPRRVRPLFRFRRNKDRPDEPDDRTVEAEDGTPEDANGEDDHPSRVRPVRVVKFVPGPEGEPQEGTPEEAPFAEVEVVDEGETPFGQVETYDGETDAPFAEEEVNEEADAPFEVEEFPSEGMAFAEVVEEVEPSDVTEEERADVPEVPFAVIEEVEREELVDDGASDEEEAELGDDLDFRQEETPVKFERDGIATGEGTDGPYRPATGEDIPATPPTGTEPVKEEKPHYHKYLKPDEDLVSKPQARGRPTGFDRDLESEAGEIDFGIDLIDPHERKKKKVPRKGDDQAPKPKKGTIGGHDSDAEVGTRELGVDIGVDYSKRRKRRI